MSSQKQQGQSRKRPLEEESNLESSQFNVAEAIASQLQMPPRTSTSTTDHRQNAQPYQNPAGNSYLTIDPNQAQHQPFEGPVWDDILLEVKANDAARRAQAEQDPVAHARALAEFQSSGQPTLTPTNEERVAAPRRLAELRNLSGNDFISRALHDPPDAINAGNLAHRQGYNLEDVRNAEGNDNNTNDTQDGDGQKSASKGVSKGANRFLRLN